MSWTVLNPQPGAGELIAVHAALLPTGAAGQVVYFGDWSSWPGRTLTRVYDLDGGDATSIGDPQLATTNLFCAGQAFLADGRLLVAGGRIGAGEFPGTGHFHETHEAGERACWIFEPRSGRFVAARQMHFQPGSDARGGGRWYPTLVTLPSGEVWMTAGHPAEDDDFEGRHNNHTPERYSPTLDTWTPMVEGAERTAPAGVVTDSYPRYHVTRAGTLFSDTYGLHEGLATVAPRSYQPYGGSWGAPEILPIPDDYYGRGSASTSVLLPLLPSDGYDARVLAVNGLQAYRINASAQQAAWVAVPDRSGPSAGQRRDHGYAVLLPTGKVALVGGVQDSRTAQALPAFQPELYDPGIDWQTATYRDVALDPADRGDWDTLDDDPAGVPRGYHSTALLLPDGRVWTGGSTEVDTSPWPDQERRMEVWDPPYPAGARPQLVTDRVSAAYGEDVPIQVATPAGDPIQRVALLRCGSCTHGFDSDQRYVGVELSGGGGELTATIPDDPAVAPPGHYMLWVVDSAGRPCEQAAFLRVCDQEVDVLMERSTLSRHEVAAMSPPLFVNSFFVVLDGFMPHELGDPVLEPQVTLEWLGGGIVDEIALNHHGPSPEDPSLAPDRSHRVTFAYDLTVTDVDGLYAGVPDTPEGLEIRVRVKWRHHEVERRLRLTLRANPRMNDGPVEWLSTDLRVFQARPGDDQVAPGLTLGNDPLAFLVDLLDDWNGRPVDQPHPFSELAETMDESPLELAPEVGGEPVFNFAIARVCMVAPEQVTAADVRVFLRLFPTWTLGFEYDAQTYPRVGNGAGAMPHVGVLADNVRTIPCFGAPRGANLLAPGDVVVNRRTLEGHGEQEDLRYFGCWLDFNRNPAVLAELRGDHPCLVAEVHYPDDPISPGATPGTSDNLAQRNLAVVRAPNPSGPGTRLIDVTFTVTPSKFAPRPPGAATHGARKRGRPDELMIQWGNLPPDTHATIYWPEVEVDEIVSAASGRLGPAVLTRVDGHTIRCRVGGTTYIPIPGNREADIAGLLTLELPPDLVKGQRYRLVAHQVDGTSRRIIGSVQLDVPISTSELILPGEERRLGVLRWIHEAIGPDDRWRPIFDRWLGHVESRVREMGGDPSAIEPIGPGERPGGDGRPGERFTGMVSGLIYACDGSFDGFVVVCGRQRRSYRPCGPGLERPVRRAFERRRAVTVQSGRTAGQPERLIVHRCWSLKALLRCWSCWRARARRSDDREADR